MIENLGRNITRLRKELGMTQDELAEKVGVRKQSISNIERGNSYPTLENLEKISQVLRANAIQLFGTANEIAVSDTPVILNKIDEYRNDIQVLLKVDKLLEDGNFVQQIEELSRMVYDINEFLNGKILFNDYGQPEEEFDNPGQYKRTQSEIEKIPFDKISKAKEEIEFILANKDKI